MSMNRCKHLSDGVHLDYPFDDVIALDYYDGPIAGVATCKICARAYSFETVETVGDLDGVDVRIALFYPLDRTRADQVIAAQANMMKSSGGLIRHDSTDGQATGNAVVDVFRELLANPEPPAFVVSWTGSEIDPVVIKDARGIDSNTQHPPFNWRTFMDI